MRRLALLLAAPVLMLLALPGAQADTPGTLLSGRMPSLDQGRGTGHRFAPAPVPNPDAVAPRVLQDSNAIRVSPGLTRTNTGQANAGDGYTPGTAYNGDLERRGRGSGLGSTVAPSLNVKVPVQVEFR